MDTFNILIVFLINLFKLVGIFFFYLKIRNYNNSIGIKLILYFLVINVLLYGIVVNIFRLLTNSKVLTEFGVKTNELLNVEFLELISISIFLLVLYLFINSSLFNKKFQIHSNYNNSFKLLAVLNLISIFNNFISDINNEFLFGEAIKYLSGPSAILLTFYSIRLKKYKYLLFSLPNLILILFLVFSTGVRGPIIGIFLIISFLLLHHFTINEVLKKIPIFLIPIFSVLLLNNEYSKIKFAFTSEYLSNPQGYQTITDIGNFIINFYLSGDSQIADGSNSKISEEIEFRLGARSMYSVGFIRFVETKGNTLITPLYNSLYVFFPRAFSNEKKPYPDSYNGEINGMGMYVCANEIDGQVNMTDFYSSSHYYWQYGFFGVLLFSFLSAFYIILILFVTNRKNIIIKIFIILYALKPYYFIPQFTLSDIVLMLVTKILPLLIVTSLISFFIRIRVRYR